MKKIFLLGLVILALFVAGCGNPPEDVARAEIVTDDTSDSMEAEEPEAMEEPEMEDSMAEMEEKEDMAEEAMEESADAEDTMEESDEMKDSEMMDGEAEMEAVAMDGVEEVAPTTKEFEFEGFAPGKSHAGTFDESEGVLFVKDGMIVGAKGTINPASVNTGIGGLDSHLKNDDFFDVEVYPTIEFESSSLVDGTMTGELTFHGVTHEVSFPVEVTESSLSADFMLDTTPFNMKHAGVNKEVRITFSMTI